MPAHQSDQQGFQEAHSTHAIHKEPQTASLAPAYRPDGIDAGAAQWDRLDPERLSTADILQLQRTMGNQAVAQLLGRARLSQPGQSNAVVQRNIHEFKNDAWVRVVETQPGKKDLPESAEAGKFFNDVTGAQANSLEDMHLPLVDMMMKSGKLNSLMGQEIIVTWQDLAGKLHAAAGLHDVQDGDIMPCGALQLSESNKKGEFEITKDHYKLEDPVLDSLKSFILQFMGANGQLDYIYTQPKFRDKTWKVVIDINFYPNRPLETGGLGLHKDTAGDNLFVNLIFDNTQPMPATEWTQDREPPDPSRQQTLDSKMPKKLQKEIVRAKEQLKNNSSQRPGYANIEGGTLDSNAYVSFSDELIWHSTPSPINRPLFDQEKVLSDYRNCASYNEAKEHYELNKTHVENIYEAMVILSQHPGTLLNKEFGDMPTEFTYTQWYEFYKNVVMNDQDMYSGLEKDITDFTWSDHKQSGATASALDENEDSIYVPTMAQGRTRSNSIPAQQEGVPLEQPVEDVEDVEDVKDMEVSAPRSFIRTWVRVVKA